MDDIKRKIGENGFGKAVVLMFNELKESFFENFTEEEWLYVYESSKPGTPQMERAKREIEKRVRTLEEWEKRYKKWEHSDPIRKLCIKKILSLASIKDLIRVSDSAEAWTDLETHILEELSKKTLPKEIWERIEGETKSHRLKNLARGKI